MIKKAIIGALIFIALALVIITLLHINRPYKIGIVLSTESSIGNEENLAARFYSEQLKSVKGHRLKFIIKTPPLIEKDIRTACSELIKADVSLVIGGSLSSEGVIIYDELRETDIPFWGVTTSTDQLSDRDDNFFRLTIPSDKIGENYGHFLNSQKHKKVLFIKSPKNPSYTESFAKAFGRTFNRESESIFYSQDIYTYSFGEYDAVMCVVPASSLMQILKAIHSQKASPAIYSSDWGFDEILSLFAGPLIDGVTSLTRRNSLQDKYRPLVKKFEAENIVTPTYGSVTVFAVFDLVVEALTAVGDRKETLLSYFKEERRYDSGYGTCILNKYGDPEYDYLTLRQIRDNKAVKNGRIKISK